MGGLSISKGLRLSRLALLLLGAAVLPLRAQDLPQGPQVVAGDVTVAISPGRIDLGQGSSHGILSWQGFDIGAGGVVHFDNGTGATLNRVTGGGPSHLDGRLSATGSVFLVNPAGIVIGSTGVVETGGRFVGSSLDLSDGDFLDGGDLTFAGQGGAVVNLGRVGSLGGDVALIGADVLNAGAISAPQGSVGLVAGQRVLMRDASVDEGLFSVLLGAGDVTDQGTIRAAAAELRAKGGNVYALAGNTDAVIEATAVEKVKGRIFLTAPGGKVTAAKPVKAQDSVTVTGQEIAASGRIEAQEVVVKAQDETQFSGMIQTGADGFVELSGGHITFEGRVDAGGGTILIDPRNIEISDSNTALLLDATRFTTSDILGLMAGGNLILDTATGSNGAAGTIVVGSTFRYTSASDLTLLAGGDVWILADLQNAGSGDVTAVAGWDGVTGFDAALFDAVDLDTTGIFGTATGAAYTLQGQARTTSGSVFVGEAGALFGAAMGSKTGATRAYGRDIDVTGGTSSLSFASNPYAQLGFHTTGGGDFGLVAGPIVARARGDIWITGGSGGNAYGLIGHGGNELSNDIPTPTADISGDIVVEAAGDLSLIGSPGTGTDGAYAMIGHGSRDFGSLRTQGDRFGAISLEVGGELTLQDGGHFTNDPWIGHETVSGTISGAPIRVTAAQIDLDGTAQVGAGGVSTIALPMWADNTHYGTVRIAVTDSDLLVTGSTSFIDTEGPSITSGFDLILQTEDQLQIDSSFFYGNNGSGGLALAGASVVNGGGSGIFLDIGGGWSLYSTRPEGDSGLIGTLSPDVIGYSVGFNPDDPGGPHANLGNAIYYSVTPVIEVDPATITYGTVAIPGGVRLRVDGATVTPATYGLSLTREVDPDLPTSSDGYIDAGLYADAIYTTESFVGAGQILGYVRNEADLLVNPAVLTVLLADQTRVYDGTAGYTGAVEVTGFVGSDGLASPLSLSYGYAGGDGSARNAGTYRVSALSATSLQNYVLDLTDGADLVIEPKVLQVGLAAPAGCVDDSCGPPVALLLEPFCTNSSGFCWSGHVSPPSCSSFVCAIGKYYDGTMAISYSSYLNRLEGFVGDDLAEVLQTNAVIDRVNVGSGRVTADLSDLGLWRFYNGMLASNYVLPTSVTGFGQIAPMPISVTVRDGTILPFNGTNSVTLEQGNLVINRLAPGESLSFQPVSGRLAAAVPGQQEVGGSIAEGAFSAGPGTDLSNYDLSEVSLFGTVIVEDPAAEAGNPTEALPELASLAPSLENGELEPPSLNGALEVINTETTGRILEEIRAGTAFCRESVDPQYAVDCLSDRLQAVANGLSATGEYSEVRAALEDAAAQLHALALQNASESLTRAVARANDGSGRSSSRPLTAVDPGRLASVNGQAAAIIANTQLVLLRSTGNSDRRRVAFSQVGQVLGATTVLLRS